MKNKYNINDKVFVINWGCQYSKICSSKPVFTWNTTIPDYSSIDFFWENKYEPNLTLKGTINKREPKKLVERLPIYKNFKYIIQEFQQYEDRVIYLIKSDEGCFVEIGEKGLSILSIEQYLLKEFNALKEFHKGKWGIEDRERAQKEFPKELLGIVYDKNDTVLFGSSYTKGRIEYHFIPAEYTKANIPIIISSSCCYDGKGNKDLPNDAILMYFNELPSVFKLNKFAEPERIHIIESK